MQKLPKFSGRHLAKEELARIYGNDMAGDMVQPNNKTQGDAALKVQSSLVLKTQPKGSENVDSKPFELPSLRRSDSKRPAHVDATPSQDDFAPFTPQVSWSM